MKVRHATVRDADGMSVVLAEIISWWGSDRPSDPGHVQKFYVERPDVIQCSVAESKDGEILGFQVLKLAAEDNPYGVEPGWGIVGTYVKLDAGRQGVGSALFGTTLSAARRAGLTKIDATIGEDNKLGLGYYRAMGFRDYRTAPGKVSKFYELGG